MNLHCQVIMLGIVVEPGRLLLSSYNHHTTTIALVNHEYEQIHYIEHVSDHVSRGPNPHNKCQCRSLLLEVTCAA